MLPDAQKSSAKTAYDSLVDKIASTIAAVGEAEVRGLGIFKRERTEAREGRNPHSGEKIQVAAGYKVKFKPAKVLRDRLDPRLRADHQRGGRRLPGRPF